MGMALRHTSHGYLTDLLPHFQPLDRPCFSTGRGSLRTSVKACCYNRRVRPRQTGALYATCTQLQAPGLCWHINCLEFLAVLLALRRFQPLVQGKHMLVRTDNMVTLVYINCHGSICRVSQLAHPLLLWSSHIPGKLNRTADVLS